MGDLVVVNLEPDRWQFVAINSYTYFKFSHTFSNSNPPYHYRGIVASAWRNEEAEITIMQPQTLAARIESEIFCFPKSEILLEQERLLAVKAFPPPSTLNWNWSVSIMPLSGSSTTSTATTPASVANITHVSVTTTAVQLIAANTTSGTGARKALAIKNNSTTANLILGKDNTVTGTGSDFIEKVPPGLTYEFPVCYSGAIFGICDTTSTGTATVVEFVQ